MSQIETIVSKVRPIKKLSIIEDDISIFLKIIQDYSKEIGGFYNLVLLNDECLFSQNTIDFVNNHDPDLIINYSNCENEKLVKNFKTKVLDGKSKNFRYNRTYAVESDFIRETTAITLDKKETNQNEGEAIKREVADR